MPNFNYYKYEILFEDSDGTSYQANGTTIAHDLNAAVRNISIKYDKQILSFSITKVDISFPIRELMKIYDSTMVRETGRERSEHALEKEK